MEKITFIHNTELAALLLTLGFRFEGPAQYTKNLTTGTLRLNWVFGEQSADGRWRLGDVVRRFGAYKDGAECTGDDEVALVSFALLNRRRLLDWAKDGKQMVMVRKNGRVALAPQEITAGQLEEMKQHFSH